MADAYTRRARIYPALITALPITVTAVMFGITALPTWSGISALVIGSGLWVLLAEIGRHRGKRKEAELFRLWGGLPTTTLLRHVDAPNPIRLKRFHRNLEVLTALTFPTAEEEAADPSSADAIYEAAIDELRERTRDRQAFPLVFDELCNYGFRRNLWGLRRWGIALALGTLAALLLGRWSNFGPVAEMDLPVLVGLCVMNACAAFAWYGWVSPDWVRQPAVAYAQRLLESAARLQRAV